MTLEDEFLLKEFELAIAGGQYLQESIDRVFRTFALAFVWVWTVLGAVLHDSLTSKTDIVALLNQQRWLVAVASTLVVVLGGCTMANMIVSRYGDVRRTERADAIRRAIQQRTGHRVPPGELGKARPRWGWYSDAGTYVLITCLCISIQAFAGVAAFCGTYPAMTVAAVIVFVTFLGAPIGVRVVGQRMGASDLTP